MCFVCLVLWKLRNVETGTIFGLLSNCFGKELPPLSIIRLGFCDIQNNQGLVNQPKPKAEADNPYLDLDYSGDNKNLSQQLFMNCQAVLNLC